MLKSNEIHKKIARDFVCVEKREYEYQVGKHVASALAGFVAGVLSASIIWIAFAYVFKTLYVG